MKAPVTYIPNFVPDHSVWLNWFWTELPWETREGAPRRECWFNPYTQPYTYGRGEGERTYQAHPFSDETCAWRIEQIMQSLNSLTRSNYDCCFVNGYAHGRQHLGWHADDSPEMDQDHPIATVSLGAEREIWFRQQLLGASTVSVVGGGVDKVVGTAPPLWSEPEKLTLEPGSVAIMAAGMQRDWQHRIPKSPLGDACGARISLTYRRLARG